jgi:hypothetical protein
MSFHRQGEYSDSPGRMLWATAVLQCFILADGIPLANRKVALQAHLLDGISGSWVPQLLLRLHYMFEASSYSNGKFL